MSDDLVKKLRDPALGFPDCFHQAAADLIESQAAEIARLRAEITTARREGMEQAAKRMEALHKNHKYNRKTGEGSEHDVGYYRAISEGVAHILRAAAREENRPSEEIIREDRDAWPDRQANDPIRAAAKEDRQP